MQSNAKFLVLGLQRTQRITGSACRIFLHYDWQINNGFLTGQSRRVLKWWSLSGTQNKDCGAGCQKDLTRGLVSSVAQLTCYWNGYAVAVWTIVSLTTLSFITGFFRKALITVSILHLLLSQKSKRLQRNLSKINLVWLKKLLLKIKLLNFTICNLPELYPSFFVTHSISTAPSDDRPPTSVESEAKDGSPTSASVTTSTPTSTAT